MDSQTVLLNIIKAHDETKELTKEGKEKCNNDALYPESIDFPKWDDSLPTVYSYASKDKKGKYIKVSTSAIVEAFYKAFPIFKNIDMNNILIAGGCVASVIEKLSLSQKFDSNSVSDIDLFIYGLTVEEATNKIYQIGEIYNKMFPDGKLSRSDNAISFSKGSRAPKIQIILRIYDTASQVLHGFDLGSSMVGILSEDKFITTSFGLYCIENRINILIPRYRSTTYESRLAKYFCRGYSIVMPNLDMKKVKITNKLNYALLALKSSHENVMIGSFFPIGNWRSDYNVERDIEKIYRYQSKQDYMSKRLSIESFIRSYLKNGPKFYVEIPMEKTIKDTIDKSFTPIVMRNSDVTSGLSSLFRKNKLNIKMVLKMKNFDIDLFMKLVKEGQSEDKIVNTLTQDYCEEVVKNFNRDYVNFCQFNWKTENPETQLCGSFNPSFSNGERWYGDYYNFIEDFESADVLNGKEKGEKREEQKEEKIEKRKETVKPITAHTKCLPRSVTPVASSTVVFTEPKREPETIDINKIKDEITNDFIAKMKDMFKEQEERQNRFEEEMKELKRSLESKMEEKREEKKEESRPMTRGRSSQTNRSRN